MGSRGNSVNPMKDKNVHKLPEQQQQYYAGRGQQK